MIIRIPVLLTPLFLAYCANLYAMPSTGECKRLFDEALYQQAATPCTAAAETGDRPAQAMLGEIYDRKGDSEKSAYWWKLAADAGYQPARNLLAMKYYYGGSVFGPEKGWVKDLKKAFEIWHQDAQLGEPTSQFMVGLMYYKGEGVAQDMAEAWAWLSSAEGNGEKHASDILYEMSRKITPEQKRLGIEKQNVYDSLSTRKEKEGSIF